MDHRKLENFGYVAGIVILDLVMPGMGGGKVFNVIHEFGPTMPIMRSMAKIMQKGCNRFFQKPYTHAMLFHQFIGNLDGVHACGDGIDE